MAERSVYRATHAAAGTQRPGCGPPIPASAPPALHPRQPHRERAVPVGVAVEARRPKGARALPIAKVPFEGGRTASKRGSVVRRVLGRGWSGRGGCGIRARVGPGHDCGKPGRGHSGTALACSRGSRVAWERRAATRQCQSHQWQRGPSATPRTLRPAASLRTYKWRRMQRACRRSHAVDGGHLGLVGCVDVSLVLRRVRPRRGGRNEVRRGAADGARAQRLRGVGQLQSPCMGSRGL